MRAYSKQTIISAVLLAVFDNQKNHYQFYLEVKKMTFDRYGVNVIFELRDGSILSGRLSNKHNFTGTITMGKTVVKFRSYRADKYAPKSAKIIQVA